MCDRSTGIGPRYLKERMKVNYTFSFDTGLWLGIEWHKGERLTKVMTDPVGFHGNPAYKFPIYKALLFNMHVLPFILFQLEILWDPSC